MNRYNIVDLLNRGAFGRVLVVQSKASKRKYVMKEVLLSRMNTRERERALGEVAILSRLKHPHIIRYKEAFLDLGALLMVMEYADCGDLKAYIRRYHGRPPLPQQRIIGWTGQLASAVEYIHSQGVLHRDIKAQNIFLTHEGALKLGDFGIARELTQTMEWATTMVGTPYYLSPELCENKPYNKQSDMWSLGCVVYEMCTYKHPFEGSTVHSLMRNICTGRYVPIDTCFDSTLVHIVVRLLSVKPQDRPTATQLLALIFPADEQSSPSSPTTNQNTESNNSVPNDSFSRNLPRGSQLHESQLEHSNSSLPRDQAYQSGHSDSLYSAPNLKPSSRNKGSQPVSFNSPLVSSQVSSTKPTNRNQLKGTGKVTAAHNWKVAHEPIRNTTPEYQGISSNIRGSNMSYNNITYKPEGRSGIGGMEDKVIGAGVADISLNQSECTATSITQCERNTNQSEADQEDRNVGGADKSMMKERDNQLEEGGVVLIEDRQLEPRSLEDADIRPITSDHVINSTEDTISERQHIQGGNALQQYLYETLGDSRYHRSTLFLSSLGDLSGTNDSSMSGAIIVVLLGILGPENMRYAPMLAQSVGLNLSPTNLISNHSSAGAGPGR